MPTLDDIILIGSKIKEYKKPEKQDVDKVVYEVLLEKTYVKNTGSTGDFESIGVA